MQWSGSSSRTGASTAATASSTSIGVTWLPSPSGDLSLIRFAGGDGECMKSRKDKGEKAARSSTWLAFFRLPRKSHPGFSYHTLEEVVLPLHLGVEYSHVTFALRNL